MGPCEVSDKSSTGRQRRRRADASAASSSSASRTSRPAFRSPSTVTVSRTRGRAISSSRGRDAGGPAWSASSAREAYRDGARGASLRAGRVRRQRGRTRPAAAEPRRPHGPARAVDDHDRSRDGEGLRRRGLDRPRGRRPARVCPHRGRLLLRPRPGHRSTGARPIGRAPSTCPVASRPCCRASSRTICAASGRTSERLT